MDNEKYNKDDAYQTLELINSWINNIDAKISFALAYVSVLAGFVFANGSPAVFKEIVDLEVMAKGIVIKAAIVILLYITSFLSIVFMFLALKARIEKRSFWKRIFAKNIRESNSKSVMFFGAIASNSLNDFKSKTMNMDNKEIIKDLLEQVHTNSKICMKKMKYYNSGLFWLFIATSFCFVSVAFNII